MAVQKKKNTNIRTLYKNNKLKSKFFNFKLLSILNNNSIKKNSLLKINFNTNKNTYLIQKTNYNEKKIITFIF
jgi:hypothetical protein